MITPWHDLWNACYGGELCMLAAIIQHLVADSGGHTSGGRPSWIYYTLSTSHNHLILTHFLSQGMSSHVFRFGGRRVGMRSVRRHWLVVITSALSVEERRRDNRGAGTDLSAWCQCLARPAPGNIQRDLDPWLIRVKEASEAEIRSVDPAVSEYPSMTWHHFIITDRPSNTLLLTERDVTITLLAAIRPCAQFMRWI